SWSSSASAPESVRSTASSSSERPSRKHELHLRNSSQACSGRSPTAVFPPSASSSAARSPRPSRPTSTTGFRASTIWTCGSGVSLSLCCCRRTASAGTTACRMSTTRAFRRSRRCSRSRRRRVDEPLTVLVAARDEEETIARTVARLRRAFPEAEVIVADDGSRDATADAAEGAGATVLRLRRLGKGQALSAAERAAPPGRLLLSDAELEGDLVSLLNGRGDLVV